MIVQIPALEIATEKRYITTDRFSTFPACGGGAASAAERLTDTS